MTNEVVDKSWQELAREAQLEREEFRCKVIEQSAAIQQLHAAVKTAQELAARRLMEIERLRGNLSMAEEGLANYVQTDRQKTREINILTPENRQLRALLVEVYNHGENSDLHGRIGAALGAAPGEDASPSEPSEWRCVCGELKVWAYTTKIETATTIHRTDGPCYQREGASRDASSEKSETVKDSCGPGCAMGANRPAQTSDEIRDLACCDKFVRESASEFCATCGYTNLDHLRKRSSLRTGAVE